jgi:3-hydroxyisobutyrate dehydrogenase-like beta-hydroxyacid dehydrogenase
MSNVTVLGLGAMGSRMAANLLKAGHAVTVWNRSPDAAEALVSAGAKLAASPKAAAQGADFVIAMYAMTTPRTISGCRPRLVPSLARARTRSPLKARP